MEPRLSFVTLGVADLKRATDFYARVLRLPRLKTPPVIAFFELGHTYLALYPRADLAADARLPAPGDALTIDADMKKGEMTFKRGKAQAA